MFLICVVIYFTKTGNEEKAVRDNKCESKVLVEKKEPGQTSEFVVLLELFSHTFISWKNFSKLCGRICLFILNLIDFILILT